MKSTGNCSGWEIILFHCVMLGMGHAFVETRGLVQVD